MKKNLLVTGGAGFIGGAFVRLFAGKYNITVVDKLSYAGDKKRIQEVADLIKFKKADVTNKTKLRKIFKTGKFHTVLHAAAETDVDRSLRNMDPFIESNIFGTQNMVELSAEFDIRKFIHLSTDEVYGDHRTGRFKEEALLNPRNPYAATKAAAEFLITTAMQTLKLPAVIVRPANNYGPRQFPEKFIPVAITAVLKGGKIPVYGRGKQIRQWLYVDDCARGLELLVRRGKKGEIYNIGSPFESTNLNTAKLILKQLRKSSNQIKFVSDRTGHDFRYGINSAKIRHLGWKPEVPFSKGLKRTVDWYAYTN